MALLNDSLSVWDIGFRWTNYDPDWPRLHIPLLVRDNFRNLMDAILKAELPCVTISLEKPSSDTDVAVEDTVYGYLDDVYACIYGKRYNRKLLRRALIDRYDFKLWCERRGVPLPAFWFPPGWKLDYQLPEDEMRPGYAYVMGRHAPQGDEMTPERAPPNGEPASAPPAATASPPEDRLLAESLGRAESVEPGIDKEKQAERKMRANQRACIVCQQIAAVIWHEEPERTIASLVKDERIRKYGGGSHYGDATVREWIKVVAPPHVREKRGRPPKNM